MPSLPAIRRKNHAKDPSFDVTMPEKQPADGKNHDLLNVKSPPTKIRRIGTMKSEKLSEVRPMIERKALAQVNSQIKKSLNFARSTTWHLARQIGHSKISQQISSIAITLGY